MVTSSQLCFPYQGSDPHFGGLIHPIRTPLALWSEVSQWVGGCKNTTAYQIQRWLYQVSCVFDEPILIVLNLVGVKKTVGARGWVPVDPREWPWVAVGQ